jgi:hypothetical protein
MKYLEGIRLGIALISLIAELRRDEGDKQGALLGIGQLIARASGAKEDEISVLSEEFKKLFAAISALRDK